MDPIGELLSTPIPTKLWHYTSIHGFHGIVTSKRMFATDLRYLNDREEFTHAWDIARNLVDETPERESNGFPAREYLGKAVDLAFESGPLEPNRLQVFVASFTDAEDQLSQWRGYSHGSSGVSLAFDLESLRPPSGHGILVSFAPCVYELAKKVELIRHALHHFKDETRTQWIKSLNAAIDLMGKSPPINDAQQFVNKFLETNPSAKGRFADLELAVNKTRIDFLRIAALLKNPSFHEEKEWRLVLPMFVDVNVSAKNPPSFRIGKNSLIPYIAYPFSPDQSKPFPLVDVILGPGSDDNSASAAQGFLKMNGIELSPRLSAVPYRAL